MLSDLALAESEAGVDLVLIQTSLLFAFDEEERILIVSFLPKSLSRVLWTSAADINRDAMRFQRLGAILDCYVAHIASISCANVFLGAVSWNLHVQ